jgi:ubiquinone/menaquinone biosynthesis C-methylase UbiE
MHDIKNNLQAFLSLIAHHRDEDATIYDAIAPGYDRFAGPWNESFAKSALARLDDILAKRLKPGCRVLDAGCGTGERVRKLLNLVDVGEIVALDSSPKMLDMARRKIADRRVRFVEGDVRQLPFTDNTFDAVISTWVLELFDAPRQIVQEFIRVINVEGFAAYSFITLPRESAEEMTDEFSRQLLPASAHARFYLRSARRPFHECSRSCLEEFSGGLLTVATVAKCCQVENARLPCRNLPPPNLEAAPPAVPTLSAPADHN